ncbi:N6-L-threonylcarbamoyladenine synthase [Rhodobium orientis]|uniref:tRNA N6-adenosine threonylcarbamoyltransferase n=1 Tax=Rhodobium orientis TaxID=34017 RepID=A0A327JU23_9HYPH|nr:tRNA (adenosine(37)-N6)-threonylcarbamoyltransferase complex transferase subunit TsaD [Rhodobium orientis]MBB4303648.1 N6-L-threonylcarbamoyladenine synthase [Rhodobium orientis]MBK5951896.1 tRNA (adenosine(37)-N6)-threonylcarbamoyltransferase complex transferase subunit TsaD [Rhodobium orientis]RAI26748.1 tRNA (adenosine(37)-N6)-threonylcarbamoyltransferase complex transferase subunit TsaD [Rhodobium orientis]
MIVLGIETSCDETAAAVVHRDAEGRGTILSDVVWSQIEAHAAFGGVVPEIAARAHVEALDRIIGTAMAEAGVGFRDLSGIAATAGPGLVGGLLVGLTTAKAIAAASGKPLLAVNHLAAHALTPRLVGELAFPYLMFLVSGGHTQILLVRDVGHYERWGTTIDDALGEAFDKTAKLLGLAYPGGPEVEKAARQGDAKRFDLPRPLIDRPSLDFSFAGLKTAVRLAAKGVAPLTDQDVADICAAFQGAVADVVRKKLTAALKRFSEEFPGWPIGFAAAGGVASNGVLRAVLTEVAEAAGARFLALPPKLCTDNGAMIAWAGAERLSRGESDSLDFAARARWPLDESASPMVGSGRLGAKV